jgi:acyl transferase domain-containing protein
MAWGIRPQALIGHSIGEYVAACLSGVFSLEDALSLVAGRGQIMQAAPGGAMLSVALSEEETGALLDEQLSLAAINGPSLCVVSGVTKAVDELEARLVKMGVACRRLHTSHAFHSRLVEPLMGRFAEQLKKVKLNPPRIPFLSNVTGDWIQESQATDPLYWAKHLRQPVLFAAGIRKLLETPGRILLEVGPGKTLSSLAAQQVAKTSDAIILSSLRHPYEQRSDSAHLLETTGKLWLAGARIDWQAFYAFEKRQRLPLPTYPFERQRYWVEPQKRAQRRQPPTASLDKKPDIADWFYLPSWKRSNPATAWKSSAPSHEEKQKSVWLVFKSDCPLAARVLKKLSEDGQTIITVVAGERFHQQSERAFIINPGEERDYDTLLGELHARAIVPQRVLHLWNIESADDSRRDFDLFEKAQSLGFYSLLYLAQALGKWCPAERIRMLVVSSGVQEVTGDEELRPEKATLLGPCKVIPQEHPNIICRSVDVIAPTQASHLEERIAGQLLNEQETQTRGEVIAYRGTHRWVQSFESMRLEENAERPFRLRKEGVYLITGGLGNIGLELAAYLGQTLRARVVLIGRRELPAREEWAQWLANHPAEDELSIKIRKLQAIEEAGGEVLFVKADVSDEQQMMAAIEEANGRFGQIHGVVHAAGAIAGESLLSIRETGATESERQFRAKAYGLLVLEKALRGRRPDFCLLFSSLSSVLGGLGFIAYSAANIFMDVFAHKQNQLGHIPWLSVNWDGWQIKKEQIGVQATAAAAGPAMTPEEGLKAFQRILSVEQVAQVVVSTADLDARINRWVKLDSLRDTEQAKATEHSSSLHARPALQGSYVAPRNEIEGAVAAIWQTLLGIEQVGVHDNFFELGGHSLLGIQLMSRLRQDFQLELPLRTLFETPTIEALAAFIERAKSDELLAESPRQTRIERRQNRTVEELLTELEQDVNEQAML